mmetsp:Transcript_16695/g.32920  ORF Transcript_16695/g.32920 Transcript_16695/m.32920 type:complete len:272 (-) Transcript_16695:54-869(-)
MVSTRPGTHAHGSPDCKTLSGKILLSLSLSQSLSLTLPLGDLDGLGLRRLLLGERQVEGEHAVGVLGLEAVAGHALGELHPVLKLLVVEALAQPLGLGGGGLGDGASLAGRLLARRVGLVGGGHAILGLARHDEVAVVVLAQDLHVELLLLEAGGRRGQHHAVLRGLPLKGGVDGAAAPGDGGGLGGPSGLGVGGGGRWAVLVGVAAGGEDGPLSKDEGLAVEEGVGDAAAEGAVGVEGRLHVEEVHGGGQVAEVGGVHAGVGWCWVACCC